MSFFYDWQGRRIHKQVWSNNAGTGNPTLDQRYMYDGWNLIAVLDSTTLRASYAWGSDLSGSVQGAGGVGGLLFANFGLSGTNFATFDGNGNVTAFVDAITGTNSAQYEYDPFGKVIRATGPLAKANPFRFSTKFTDDESDLVYYGYRYYTPSTGRWLSRDPVGENGGKNLTALLGNDAIEKIDLIGAIKWKPAEKGLQQSYGYDPVVPGFMYKVFTDKGHVLEVWRPDDGIAYWCHGYTFDGSTAEDGPYSIAGIYVKTVLEDEWEETRCAAASGGIAVYYKSAGGTPTHSGKIAKVVAPKGAFDEIASQLNSKDTLKAARVEPTSFLGDNDKFLKFYGKYKCYVKKGTSVRGCWVKGDHELE